ncbi:MAG: DUF4271 domain-containing protein [Bacteroidales bacterium]|nr:DUF4271 domain-containing protein [Bacteroidales bacterium]
MIILTITERAIELAGRSPYRSDWLFGLLLLPIILTAVISATSGNRTETLTRTVLRQSYSSTIYRSLATPSFTVTMTGWILTTISFANILYFSHIAFSFYPFCLTGPLLWLTDLAIVSVCIAARYLITVLTGQTSGQTDLFREYLFNVSSFYRFTAIIIAPLNFMVSYLDVIPERITVISTVSIVGILLLMRELRLIHLFIRGRFSIFYLILYLCALEIGPLLIFVKYLSGTVCKIAL